MSDSWHEYWRELMEQVRRHENVDHETLATTAADKLDEYAEFDEQAQLFRHDAARSEILRRIKAAHKAAHPMHFRRGGRRKKSRPASYSGVVRDPKTGVVRSRGMSIVFRWSPARFYEDWADTVRRYGHATEEYLTKAKIKEAVDAYPDSATVYDACISYGLNPDEIEIGDETAS